MSAGCSRGVGKPWEMSQPRMKEREFWGREGKLKLASFQFSKESKGAGVGLDVRRAGLDAENMIFKKKEPLSWTVPRWRCSVCFWFLIYQESGKI